MEELKSWLRKWRYDLNNYGKNNVRIIDKSSREQKFELNKPQQYIDERIEAQREKKGYVRVIILKGRQQGASKYCCLRNLRNTTLYTNVHAYVMAHDSDTTSSLFEDYKRLYNSLPEVPLIKPAAKRSNAKELVFEEITSSIRIGTAGSEEVGRGMTLNRFHGSETAFWKNGDKILAGVLQAIPSGVHGKGTEIILESTANGVGNKFYRLCMQAMRGEGEFELIFIPWWWTDEYRVEDSGFEPTDEEWEYYDTYIAKDIPDEEDGAKRLAWRRNKIFELGDNKFKQEYPSNPQEAFQMSGKALFKPEWVKCAQDTNVREDKGKPLVVGVDAAESGDRTVICFRRGNKVIGYNVYNEMNEMRLAGICDKIIREMKPAKAFFDKAYANGCVQRLHELGHVGIAKAIPFGSGAIEPDRFVNKRAEMHWLAKEWMEDGYVEYDPETGQGGVDIPVDDAFAADLACIPEAPATSNGKIKMVDKSKIKEEYGMSPDILDAFVLTFAEPVAHHNVNEVRVKHKSPTDIMYGR